MSGCRGQWRAQQCHGNRGIANNTACACEWFQLSTLPSLLITHNVCGLCLKSLSEAPNDPLSQNSSLFWELLTRNSCCNLCEASRIVTHRPKDCVCLAVLLMLSSYRYRCRHQLCMPSLWQQMLTLHAIWINKVVQDVPGLSTGLVKTSKLSFYHV